MTIKQQPNILENERDDFSSQKHMGDCPDVYVNIGPQWELHRPLNEIYTNYFIYKGYLRPVRFNVK